ncbi:MAG TPA: FixG Ig-like domain-containing protein, partial [Hyphomicrobiaceae bacterium]|nr:FixG Ig-like domain-containing protein [Hyphomicrobiaceae bacterium]
NPPFIMLADGSIRNAYAVKILNKRHEPRAFRLAANGLPGAQIAIAGGGDPGSLGVDTDDVRDFRVLVTVPATAVSRLDRGPTPFQLVVTDRASGQISERMTHFQR